MICIAIVLSVLAIVGYTFEGYRDRFGQGRTGKVRDTLVLVAIGSSLSILLKLFADVHLLKTVALLLGWRILIFDYIVHSFLKRFSESHKNINIWKYVGETAVTDKIISNVNWKLRMAIRVILFGASLWWFLV